MRYLPSLRVVVERVWLFVTSRAVIVAPLMTAPLGSVTVPSIEPVGCCANAGVAKLRAVNASGAAIINHSFKENFLCFIGSSNVIGIAWLRAKRHLITLICQQKKQ